MPYRVDLRKIQVLKSSDPAAYRPLLDHVEAEIEDGPLAVSEHPNWTQAKSRVQEHLDGLRRAVRRRMGKPEGVQQSLFSEAAPSPLPGAAGALTARQAQRFALDEVLVMRRHLGAASMEEVDSRHRDLPF